MKEIKYKSIKEVLLGNKGKKPQVILKAIDDFFELAGSMYRRGLMLEEEFYACAYSIPEIFEVCKSVNNLYVDQRLLGENYYNEFKANFLRWKKTKELKVEGWMYSCFSQQGDMKTAIEWFYELMDKLGVPVNYFEALSRTYNGCIPAIGRLINGNTLTMYLEGRCSNLDIVLNTPINDIIGKRHYFHLDNGDGVEMTINEIENKKYKGTGIIPGYIDHESKIVLDMTEDNELFLFNERTYPAYQIISQTYINPVPNHKWFNYEMARLRQAMEVDMEYKLLMIPYLLGKRTKKEHKKEGNIIMFS